MDCPPGSSQVGSGSSAGGSFAGPALVGFLGFGLLELRFVHSLMRLSPPSKGGLTLKNDRLDYFFRHLDLYLASLFFLSQLVHLSSLSLLDVAHHSSLTGCQ